MAGSYNKIIIIGNLGRDPEMRYLPSGDAVAEFTIATSERRKGQDGQQQEQTTWFRVSAFGKLAETCNQYLHKGSYTYIEGTLNQREYTTNEGVARQSLDVRAREMRMLDRRGDAGGDFGGGSGGGSNYNSQGAAARPAPSANDDANMDDIPF